MPTSPQSQDALSKEPQFSIRVKTQAQLQAFVVLAEGPPVMDNPPTVTQNAAMNIHIGRQNYARSFLQGMDVQTERICQSIVNRSGLLDKDTSYDYIQRAHVTTASDGDIFARIAADWNFYAGV